MPHDSQDISPVFRIDVGQSASDSAAPHSGAGQNDIAAILQQLVAGQDRQNELMEEMIDLSGKMLILCWLDDAEPLPRHYHRSRPNSCKH